MEHLGVPQRPATVGLLHTPFSSSRYSTTRLSEALSDLVSTIEHHTSLFVYTFQSLVLLVSLSLAMCLLAVCSQGSTHGMQHTHAEPASNQIDSVGFHRIQQCRLSVILHYTFVGLPRRSQPTMSLVFVTTSLASRVSSLCKAGF